MKRVLSLIMAVILMLALSGCACEHQWQSADCVNPRSCEKCGEVQGEALGHSFQAASCTAPETCSLCGETRGEALEHSLSEPEFKESAMSMVCSLCGYEAELSHEDYMQQVLCGEWGFYENVSPDGVLSAEIMKNIGALGTRLYVNEDKSARLILGEHIKDESFDNLSWEYLSCGEVESGYFHMLSLKSEELTQPLILMNSDEGDAIMLPLDSELTSYDILKKRPDMREFVCGIWLDSSGGSISTVKLNEDFTAELIINGQTSEGTWYLGDVDDGGLERIATLTLSITLDEKSYEYDCKMYLGKSAEPIETAAQDAYFYCYALDKSFERVSGEQVDRLNKAMELGKSLPVGDWHSTVVSCYENGNTLQRNCGDYSLSLNEDGSFSAELDGQYTGYWWLDKVRAGGGDYYYTYRLGFEGYEQTATIEMMLDPESLYGDSSMHLDIQDYPKGYTLEFSRERGDMKSVFEGTWIGCFEGEISTLEIGADYSFSLEAMGGIEGAWSINSTSTNGDYVDYNLDFMSSEAGESLYANYSEYVGPGSEPNTVNDLYLAGCIFQKVTDGDTEGKKARLQELMEAAPGRLVGTWVPEEGENARTYDGTDYSGYSVSFNADGSFLADFEQQYTGTWVLESINESVAYLDMIVGEVHNSCTLYFNFDRVHVIFQIGEDYPSYYFTR